MEKFCDNPLCPAHIDVDDGLLRYGILNLDLFGSTYIVTRFLMMTKTGDSVAVCSICKNGHWFIEEKTITK